MKKPAILFLGILLGTIFMSQQVLSFTGTAPEKYPPGFEESGKEINVFPNPSDGRFQLSFDFDGKQKVNAKVFDITGKLVEDITESLVIDDTSVTAQVELEHPSSGIYFIRVSWGKTLLTKKIIIR